MSYQAQDQDVAMLIKEFDYGVNEENRPIRDDIWKICSRCVDIFHLPLHLHQTLRRQPHIPQQSTKSPNYIHAFTLITTALAIALTTRKQ